MKQIEEIVQMNGTWMKMKIWMKTITKQDGIFGYGSVFRQLSNLTAWFFVCCPTKCQLVTL